ncbi:3'-5' exonuclease [Solibacillus sp. FSL W8-0474]|uniref:3'-5' exonuclease n=1 Tax=Solibacillus sp. FSL W8-0474 TaxID=2975336 RepID=UPI0030FA7824
MNWFKKIFSKKPNENESIPSIQQEERIDYTVKLRLDSDRVSVPVLNVDFDVPKPRRITDNSNHLTYSKVRKLTPDFTVLDFETTGFDPEEDSIIQVAAVKYRNFEKTNEYITFVNPIYEIPPKIMKITGITDDDVGNAPYLSDVIPDLLSFLEDETIVAHNASFDMTFLLTSINEYKLPYVRYKVIDTLLLARKCIDNTSNHKLVTLKRFLKLNHLKSHNALHDCYVTAELYKYCYEKSLVTK